MSKQTEYKIKKFFYTIGLILSIVLTYKATSLFRDSSKFHMVIGIILVIILANFGLTMISGILTINQDYEREYDNFIDKIIHIRLKKWTKKYEKEMTLYYAENDKVSTSEENLEEWLKDDDELYYAYQKFIDEQLRQETKQDEYIEEDNNINNNSSSDNVSSASGFFNGCTTLEMLESRHKSLSKAFHPDFNHGDEELFKNMQTEYEEKIKDFI